MKFAPCHLDAYLILVELALRDRPGAIVAFLPEGAAGMDEENL
jgi:hypothetical protein